MKKRKIEEKKNKEFSAVQQYVCVYILRIHFFYSLINLIETIPTLFIWNKKQEKKLMQIKK